MVYKRVRGWTSGWSSPRIKLCWVPTPPPPPSVIVSFCLTLSISVNLTNECYLLETLSKHRQHSSQIVRQSARDYFIGLKKCRRINNKTELKKNKTSKTKVISIQRSKIVISRWTAIWFSWIDTEKKKQNDLLHSAMAKGAEWVHKLFRST